MPNAELVKNRQDFFPSPKTIPGNIWSSVNPHNETPFSEIYPNGEHSEFSSLTETARDLVRTVQTEFIQDRWHFNSIMGNDRNLHIVFINFSQGATTKQCPPLSFIEPHLLKPETELTITSTNIQTGNKTVRRSGAIFPTEPINEVLKAANLYAHSVLADYNSLKLSVRKGLLSKHVEELIFFQSGIALISISFQPIGDVVGAIGKHIQDIWTVIERDGRKQPYPDEAEQLGKLQAKQKNLKAWLAANPIPKPLF